MTTEKLNIKLCSMDERKWIAMKHGIKVKTKMDNKLIARHKMCRIVRFSKNTFQLAEFT